LSRAASQVAGVFLISLVMASSVRAQEHALVPLDDQAAAGTLLPPGVTRDMPELRGSYVYLWSLDDGTQVLQFYGDFSARLGPRSLQSQEAVIWMQKNQWEGKTYYHFEVFLSRHAQVRDSAGTITTGPSLFVTFNSTLPAEVHDDVHTTQSSAQTELYQAAASIRQQLRSTASASQPGPLEVYPPSAVPPAARPKARPTVQFKGDSLQGNRQDRTVTVIGNVYISQGTADSAEFMELRTDAAVIFLAQGPSGPAGATTKPADLQAPALQMVPGSQAGPSGRESAAAFGLAGGVGTRVAGVYLQGNVTLSRGERRIRASELYYDFENDRALILDAVMWTMIPERDVPIYVRAAQVRQLSTTDYVARNATISTSEFHTPHLYLGAKEIHLTDATFRNASGELSGFEGGKFEIRDATLNLEGVPIAYWPYVAGDFRRSETSIRSLRTAYSNDFGATFESKWYLFNLLGVEKPEGVDGTLRLDYFSKRGPGVGTDLDYEVENAYGLVRTYYMYDHGEDNLGPYRNGELDSPTRGRTLIRHRQILPDGWELTLEASHICDPNFLEEYFNAEFEQGKEQETLVYLKKQQDNWAFTTLGQWRILDFLTQTEHLPDLGFNWAGQPLAEIASFYNESHVGFVRYRPDDRRLFDSDRLFDNTDRTDVNFRSETRNEIQVPIKLTSLNLNVVPFATGRAGWWDGSQGYWHGQPHDHSVDRIFGTAGVRAGTQFWKLFENASSELFDVNGIRHLVSPEITAWASGSDRPSRDLTPFDPGIEDIDDFYGTSIALRQRWQTKRGGPAAGGDGQWRKVDWITFDIELNLFGNTPKNNPPTQIGRFYPVRIEDSAARNHVRMDSIYRISDTTAILSDGNVDLNDGDMDTLGVSYAVERTPRFSYFVGYRQIHDTRSELIGSGINYKATTKYEFAVRTYYDIRREQTDMFDITIIRKFPRWYGALTVGVDKINDDFAMSVSVWPEGAPQMTLGNRRYSSLSETTGIKPEY
jgi:hypothetical protein